MERGRKGVGLRFTDLLFDLSLTSKRPQTDMWLPSGLAYHAIIPADLFLNVSWIVPLWSWFVSHTGRENQVLELNFSGYTNQSSNYPNFALPLTCNLFKLI